MGYFFVKSERELSVSYIKELHAALLRSQMITEAIDNFGQLVRVPLTKGDGKKLPNYPEREGIVYYYCPPEQVAAEMDRLIDLHQTHLAAGVSAEVAAAWLHHRFTQIHPFQDGNGRVARAIASLVLIKEGLFPLVVTRDDHGYISALEAADDGDLNPLVDLFAKLQRVQFRKATAVSEDVLADAGLETVLGNLQKSAEKVAADKRQALRRVFEWARLLENDVADRLGAIADDIRTALMKVQAGATASVITSNQQTDYYYRAQIIENAKLYLHYFADTSEYRSWVALSMTWERRARLVFSFHGIGRPFNGSLICAPFFDFRDTDDDGQTQATLVPVAEEGFVFFYNDTKERLLSRFRPWREQVLKVSLKELSQNL
jgi:fido (protein-threonine AMPylation protein)